MECLHRSEERLLNAAPAVASNLLQRLLDDIGYVPILLAAAVLICFTGNALIKITDPVESNYALTAMEMLQSGDYVSPRIFGNYWYDKPVLFSLGNSWPLFTLFGTTEFAARFSQSVFGLVGVVMAYGFASRLYDKNDRLRRGLGPRDIAGILLPFPRRHYGYDLVRFLFSDAHAVLSRLQ